MTHRSLLTLGLRFLEMAMLWPSLLRKEMGDLVLAINAVLSSGLRLGLSEIACRKVHEKMNDEIISEKKYIGIIQTQMTAHKMCHFWFNLYLNHVVYSILFFLYVLLLYSFILSIEKHIL